MSSHAQMLPSVHYDVVIVGGGQSGLALGHYLARSGRRFTILDGAPAIGHSWRSRWDSLRLISPCPYNDLPGLRFPAPKWSFPHKDDVADYLARYAETFALPVRFGQRVRAVEADGDRYRVVTDSAVYLAQAVVIATGPYQGPNVPAFASGGQGALIQLHSSEYRNPAQLPAGHVLVVGCGNSGAGIAQELATGATHAGDKVHLALGRTASGPRRILGRDVFWWGNLAGINRVTIDSRRGQRMSQQPDGLIGITPDALAERGIVLHSRVVGIQDNEVRFASGDRQQVAAIIWATGFRPDYGWIHLPIFDDQGRPLHRRGVTAAPGLYFLGLKWQYRIDSSLLGGVGRDAEYLSSAIAAHLAGVAPAPASQPSILARLIGRSIL